MDRAQIARSYCFELSYIGLTAGQRPTATKMGFINSYSNCETSFCRIDRSAPRRSVPAMPGAWRYGVAHQECSGLGVAVHYEILTKLPQNSLRKAKQNGRR